MSSGPGFAKHIVFWGHERAGCRGVSERANAWWAEEGPEFQGKSDSYPNLGSLVTIVLVSSAAIKSDLNVRVLSPDQPNRLGLPPSEFSCTAAT